MIKIQTPLTDEVISNLKSGDMVQLSGVIYTARDAAHARLINLIEAGKELPFDIKGQVIYYAGPSPAKPGKVIGSLGPTTAGRMDAYVPTLLSLGLKGMIGKGSRSQAVIDSIKENKAIYFAATGGAAALLAKCVTSAEIIAYEDLGCEAIRKLTVIDMPLIVINDCLGNDYYKSHCNKTDKSPINLV